MMHLSFILIMVANGFIITSAIFRDILILRIFLILGTASILTYHSIFVLGFPEKMAFLFWDTLFISIHIYHSMILFWERRPMHLSQDEVGLYSLKFRGMSRYKFNKLLKAGMWKIFSSKEIIFNQNDAPSALMLLYEGKVTVIKDGEHVATLKPGSFIGEMSIISQKPISATIVTDEKTKVFYWPLETLSKILTKDASLSFSLNAIMGADMVSKLGRKKTD